MLREHTPSASALNPEDLSMLQQVFDRICDKRGIIKHTGRASDVAGDLIDLFQHGIRNEVQLLRLLSANLNYPDE